MSFERNSICPTHYEWCKARSPRREKFTILAPEVPNLQSSRSTYGLSSARSDSGGSSRIGEEEAALWRSSLHHIPSKSHKEASEQESFFQISTSSFLSPISPIRSTMPSTREMEKSSYTFLWVIFTFPCGNFYINNNHWFSFQSLSNDISYIAPVLSNIFYIPIEHLF